MKHRWLPAAPWRADRQRPHPELTLHARRVYIVPSAAGGLFAALVCVMLLASINYQLSLGHLLTFWLISAGLVSMFTTQAQLPGLQLRLNQPPAGFAGRPLRLDLDVAERHQRQHRSVRLQLGEHGCWIDLFPGERRTVPIDLPALGRGVHALPPVLIECRYPYGLFRAWSWWRPAAEQVVWPTPEVDAPLPAALHPRGDPEPDPGQSLLRPYRHGDAMRQIAWKSSGRTLSQGLDPLVREHSTLPASIDPCRLDWRDTASLSDPEQRLQRLCAWLLEAEARGQPWILVLPGDPDGTENDPLSAASPPSLHADLDRLARFRPDTPARTAS